MAVRATSLFQLNHDVCNVLDTALDDTPAVRASAIRVVGLHGPAGAFFLDQVEEELRHDSWIARAQAIDSWIAIGGDPARVTDVLLDSLRSPECGVERTKVLDRIGQLGFESVEARDAVRPYLDSLDAELKSAAAWAYAMVGGDTDTATKAMMDALSAPHHGDQATLVSSRAFRLAGAHRISIPMLADILGRGSAADQALAIRLLGETGSAAEPVLELLQSLETNANPMIATAAQNAARRIEYELRQ
jgi:hypothetical protein